MKTLILIAVLSLSACTSTPFNPETAKPWELYEHQYNQTHLTPWERMIGAIADGLRYDQQRRLLNPAFRCTTYGRTTTCSPY